jgi:hypothetical protein
MKIHTSDDFLILEDEEGFHFFPKKQSKTIEFDAMRTERQSKSKSDVRKIINNHKSFDFQKQKGVS